MKKRLISTFLSAIMILSAVTSATVFAAESSENSSVYNSEYSNYTANKITHPENGTKAVDGIVDYIGNGVVTDQITGIGDRAQNYSWSAIGYGDWVYVGTCPNAMMQTLNFMNTVLGNTFDKEIMTATLNAMFNGSFFISEEDGGDPKGILVKVNTKTGEVKLLMSKATTDTNVQFRNVVEYKGKFYFCGSVNGLPSVYQVDPATDEYKLVYQSISAADYYKAYQMGISVGIRGIGTFDDKLIISLVGLDGAYICETDNPKDPESFKVIANMNDMFDYPAYRYQDSIYGGSIWDMVEFNGSLYVSVCTGRPENKPDNNTMQSFALIRGDRAENGNWTWNAVVGDKEKDNAKYTFGIDPERTRSGAANLCVYNDYLYIGEYNDEEIALEDLMFSKNCDFVNANLEQSVNLYRMDSDENLELVMGDADEMFPEGSLTEFGSGFGRNENQYIWRMQVYNNKLYVGTFDTSSLLEPIGQFTNGDLLDMTDEEWETQIEYLRTLIDLILSKKNTPEVVTANDIDSALTDNQAQSIADSVNQFDDVDKNMTLKLNELQELLDELENNLNDDANGYFIEIFNNIKNYVDELFTSISDNAKEYIGSFISDENVAIMRSFLECSAYLSTAERGFDLYVLDEDMNVETITTNGFGDPYNHGCRVFALTDDDIVLGTANPFYGTQLWIFEEIEFDEMIYDVNKDGIVSIDDVTYMQQVLSDIIDKPEDFDVTADFNNDGEATIDDATIIQYYLAGLQYNFN